MSERLNAMPVPVFCARCNAKYMDDEMHTCTDKAILDYAAGKTLRDEFAMHVISGWIPTTVSHPPMTADEIAKGAYEVADAMLKAREES